MNWYLYFSLSHWLCEWRKYCILNFHFWCILVQFLSLNTLLIFTVTESNIATFILIVNTAACSSKGGIVKVFLLKGTSLDLPQINEHFLSSDKQHIHIHKLYRMHHKIHVTVNLNPVLGWNHTIWVFVYLYRF